MEASASATTSAETGLSCTHHSLILAYMSGMKVRMLLLFIQAFLLSVVLCAGPAALLELFLCAGMKVPEKNTHEHAGAASVGLIAHMCLWCKQLK
jgi:hypothetical protein